MIISIGHRINGVTAANNGMSSIIYWVLTLKKNLLAISVSSKRTSKGTVKKTSDIISVGGRRVANTREIAYATGLFPEINL